MFWSLWFHLNDLQCNWYTSLPSTFWYPFSVGKALIETWVDLINCWCVDERKILIDCTCCNHHHGNQDCHCSLRWKSIDEVDWRVWCDASWWPLHGQLDSCWLSQMKNSDDEINRDVLCLILLLQQKQPGWSYKLTALILLLRRNHRFNVTKQAGSDMVNRCQTQSSSKWLGKAQP